jgi:hypothetical protein
MSENPQSFFNCVLGGYRNLIISVSCGIATYGFSRTFPKKESRNIMKKLSLLIYISAFFIILNTVLLLRRYLNLINEEDKKKLPKYIDLNKWRIYEYIGWFLVLIVSGLIFISSKKYAMSLFNMK